MVNIRYHIYILPIFNSCAYCVAMTNDDFYPHAKASVRMWRSCFITGAFFYAILLGWLVS